MDKYLHIVLYNRLKLILHNGTKNRLNHRLIQWDKNRNLIHKLKN